MDYFEHEPLLVVCVYAVRTPTYQWEEVKKCLQTFEVGKQILTPVYCILTLWRLIQDTL